MIRIAACDDVALQLEMMLDLIRDHMPSAEVIGFSSGTELLDYVRTTGPFDIYFLDCMMPGVDGIDTARRLREYTPEGSPWKVVFVTASTDFLMDSYDVHAYHYLLKPVDVNKLHTVLDEIAGSLAEMSEPVYVRTAQGQMLLRPEQILYVFLNEDRQVSYHLKDGSVVLSLYTVRQPFRSIVSPLVETGQFAMCSVTAAVNLRQIRTLNKDSIVMSDGAVLYPSRSSYSALNKAWKALTGTKRVYTRLPDAQ